MKRLYPILFLSLACVAFAKEDAKKPVPALDDTLFGAALWATPLETIKGPEEKEEPDEADLRKQLKDQGFDLGKIKNGNFSNK